METWYKCLRMIKTHTSEIHATAIVDILTVVISHSFLFVWEDAVRFVYLCEHKTNKQHKLVGLFCKPMEMKHLYEPKAIGRIDEVIYKRSQDGQKSNRQGHILAKRDAVYLFKFFFFFLSLFFCFAGVTIWKDEQNF